MNKSIVLIISCLCVAAAQQSYFESRVLETTEMTVDSTASSVSNNINNGEAAKPYSFYYKVKDEESKNDYSHSESFDGTLTKGAYVVQLPDGRRQTVEYQVDSNGYVAQVKYEGEAQYPQLSRSARLLAYGTV